VVSAWARIILLAIAIGVVNKIVTGKPLFCPDYQGVWRGILFASITAYLVNDAGVLACATCLAYGFSYLLLKLAEGPDKADNSPKLSAVEGKVRLS
jgi:hypothetical protein